MAIDIRQFGLIPASTYYFVVVNESEQYWNDVDDAFETYTAANWAEYAVGAATPNSSGAFFGTFPTAITAAGTYTISLHIREGATPAVTDDLKGQGPFNWSGTSELAFAGGTGMTIQSAREFLAAMVRDGSGESVINVDYAIQTAGDHFCRETQSVIRTDSVAITEGSTSFPLTSPITAGFRPERVFDVWLTTKSDPVTIVNYAELQAMAVVDAGSSVPTHLAFLDNTSNGMLWREPDDDYTARIRYWLPFTTWTPGATDAPTLATVLNIPSDIIKPVLTLGAASVLKGPSPEKAFASESWKKFIEYEAQQMGAGNLGVRVRFLDANPKRFSRLASRFQQTFLGER